MKSLFYKVSRSRTLFLALPVVLFMTASASARQSTPLYATLPAVSSEAALAPESKPDELQLAGLPCFYGYSWRGAPYWTGAYCGPQVPTTKTMQNLIFQSHQWQGEYPVCQPLYAPSFGHYETQWHQFPGEPCPGNGPVPELHAF